MLDKHFHPARRSALDAGGYQIEGYREADVEVLADELSRHPDPGVRIGVAANTSVPRKILKMLSGDNDPSVAGAAQESMKR